MKTRFLAACALAAALSGCSDSSGPSGADVSLLFAASGGTPSAAPALQPASSAAGYVLTDGQSTLILTRAEVVLREIELKGLLDLDCDSGDCEEFEIGPIVVDVPLDGSTAHAVAVSLPAGTYREIEFEIHKVTSGDDDAALRASHPHLDQKSIRVEGTWNGTAFVYSTDLDVEQEFDLNPPLVVETSQDTNVTVRLDLSAWFRGASGSLLDPATANKGGANESRVNDNIKQSIEAFEDHDGDGDDADES
ncbi:MAG: hypothetical protein ACT4PE_07900 [Candidatus Eiseniibacteriota bacterium]